ncbi:hypothetical protein P7K49_026032 [Saguinus oedipus]|uniref:Uncharacterized protein n=1 Tax=Saguinus oedipus TaxID=9490 RepID=A0ABQ9UKE0_SAGOE|nr:hypothetical protein P7K49_026032 [Saguinus oedipus]
MQFQQERFPGTSFPSGLELRVDASQAGKEDRKPPYTCVLARVHTGRTLLKRSQQSVAPGCEPRGPARQAPLQQAPSSEPNVRSCFNLGARANYGFCSGTRMPQAWWQSR